MRAIDYRWNGEPCEGTKILIRVSSHETGNEHNFKWWRPYVGKIMEAMEVRQGTQYFVIYNGNDEAEKKLLSGGGPNLPHKSFEFFTTNVEPCEGDWIVRVVDCKEHKWSENEKPIFKTTSKWCTACFTSQVLEKMIKDSNYD